MPSCLRLVSLSKYSFKIVKFMIFITFTKSSNRKNLVSISSIGKNLEAVIRKCVELARVSEAVLQKCCAKVR